MVRKNLKLRRKILKNKLDNVEKTKFKMNWWQNYVNKRKETTKIKPKPKHMNWQSPKPVPNINKKFEIWKDV
jgi:hypothetical protein